MAENESAAQKKAPTDSRLDALKTFDPSDVAKQMLDDAPPGTERVVDPIRKKLIQVVPLTEQKMKEALSRVLEDDRYEHYAVKLTFPTSTTWMVSLGTKRKITDVHDKSFMGGAQEIGGNRMIPIEEFTRSIYTCISRYATVKRGHKRKYGGLGVINNDVAEE